MIGCTVAELSRRLSWTEYLEWMAFDAMEPIGFRRDDYHAAHLAMAATAPHVTGELAISDFMPFAEGRFDPEEDEEELTLTQWAAAATGRGLAIHIEEKAAP